MDFEELLELLEIDSPDDFTDFEHFAALIELDEEIPFKMFSKILIGVEPDLLATLTDNFFEDILQGVHDDNIDFYTLLSTIRQGLLGLAKASVSKEEKTIYVDELYRFRNWYMFDSVVLCTRASDGITKELPISEALTLKRVEQFGEGAYTFDFSQCMDYEIDEYTMPIDAVIDEDYEEIVEEDEDFYENGLIHRDFPVIDGEDVERSDELDEFDEDIEY